MDRRLRFTWGYTTKKEDTEMDNGTAAVHISIPPRRPCLCTALSHRPVPAKQESNAVQSGQGVLAVFSSFSP